MNKVWSIQKNNSDPRVLLINPNFHHAGSYLPPLGLAYLATSLEKANINVKILDANVHNLSQEQIIEKIKELKPNIIGITVYTSLIKYIKKLGKNIKLNSNAMLILGGPHPTVMPEQCLRELSADLIILNEGEITIVEICKKYNKKINLLERINGVAYLKNKKYIQTASRKLIADLDSVPFPARHLLPVTKYKTLGINRTPFATILTSRGCPGKCIYCTKAMFGFQCRQRSPENIMKEIRQLKTKYKIKELDFMDDTFTLNRNRVIKLCNMMIKEKINIPWRCSGGVRVDMVDQELLNKMKEAGCNQVSFGVESGDDEILKKIGKELNTEQIRKAFNAAKKAKIETTGFFMLGLPHDNIETMNKTIEFSIELNPDYAQFTITSPLPGTALWNWVKNNGTFLIKDMSELNFLSGKANYITNNFTKEEVENMYKKAYKKFYFRPKYLMKRLIKLKSAEDLKAKIRSLKYLINFTNIQLWKKT